MSQLEYPIPQGLLVPEMGLVGPDGRPVEAGAQVRGLDVYEATGGADTLEALALIADLRRRREKSGTIYVAPDQLTDALLIEVELFNQEVWSGRELSTRDRTTITAAMQKRLRRQARARARTNKEKACPPTR